MSTAVRLCRTRNPEWWDTGNDGNRLALALCRLCSGCPDNDPRPCGVIRGAVAYGDDRQPRTLCTCGYPAEAWNKNGRDAVQLCRRCQLPTMDRYREAIIRWRDRGDTYRTIGSRIAFSPDHVRAKYHEWTTDPGEVVPA